MKQPMNNIKKLKLTMNNIKKLKLTMNNIKKLKLTMNNMKQIYKGKQILIVKKVAPKMIQTYINRQTKKVTL